MAPQHNCVVSFVFAKKTMQVAANQMFEREELRLKIEVLAVRIIQRWWKSCVRRIAKITINRYDREVL